MSQELVQTGFFDLELDVPQKTWHIGLEDKLQDTLRQRAAKIKAVVAQANFIIGEELATAQKELTYKNGGFVKWLEEEVGIDNQRAYEFIQIWEHFKMFPNIGNISEIGKMVLMISSKKDVPESAREEIVTRHEAGEKITLAVSDEIIERHKAELEAVEKAKNELQQEFDLFRDQARKDLEAKQRELEVYQENVRLQKEDFERTKGKFEEDMKSAKEERELIEKSKVQIIKEDTPETKAKLEDAEKKIKEIEEREKQIKAERDKKADDLKKSGDRVKKLTEQVKGYLAVSKQETHNEQIRTKARQCCDAYHQGINQGSARQVRPLDAQQAFGPDEWAMYDETEAALRRAADDFARLKETVASQFVDATPIVETTKYIEAPLSYIEG
jgi:hypothetical protein